jgi:tripartite ATP-independent transporter DctM subunit
LSTIIRVFDRVGIFSSWCKNVGTSVLFLMVCFTFTDVILRYVFNRPIMGAWEITGLMMVVVVFLVIAHTQNEKGHVSIDAISTRLSPMTRLITDTVVNFLSICVFGILVWRTSIQFLYYLEQGTLHSPNARILTAPFQAIIVLGCTLLGMFLIRDLLSNVSEALRRGLRLHHWLLMFGGLIVVLVLLILWMQPTLWQLSLPLVGILGIIFSLLLFLIGMPVAFALILTSLLFISHIRGPSTAFDMIGISLYRTTGSYLWATVGFFVLMGYFCLFSRLGEDLYLLFYRWIGHMRGGLAMATAGASTSFAAIVGDTVSSIVTMTAVALPEMKKYKYDDRLSTGSITAGGIIGPIIPPSIPFILYGILTGVSIGKLFVAGIIPGLLIGVSFISLIYVWCLRNPRLGAPGPRAEWRQRFVSLKGGGPIAALFLLIIAGMYTGIFTPCEGGAIGAGVALLIGLIMRRFNWKNFTRSLLEATKVSSMILLIVNGAALFAVFVEWCNVSKAATELLTGLGLSATTIVTLILLIFLVLGCLVDVLSLTLIGVPIVHPIAVALGVDPLWFATLVMLVMALGTLTPPVGINLFTMRAMAKDVPIGKIYSGVLPFVLVTIAVIGIVFAVPSLATWLPGILK